MKISIDRIIAALPSCVSIESNDTAELLGNAMKRSADCNAT